MLIYYGNGTVVVFRKGVRRLIIFVTSHAIDSLYGNPECPTLLQISDYRNLPVLEVRTVHTIFIIALHINIVGCLLFPS